MRLQCWQVQAVLISMINWIFTHQWKEAIRRTGWQQSLVIRIIMGIFMLYMAGCILVISYFLSVKLQEEISVSDLVQTFHKGIIYYLGLDMALRLVMQQAPVLAVQPYLHLPIRKSKLIHFLLGKSLLNLGNLLPLLIAGPFAFKVVYPTYGLVPMFSWSISLLCLVLFNHFLGIYLKRQFSLKPIISFLIVFGLIGLAALEYYGFFKLSSLTETAFAFLLKHPEFGFLLLLIPVAMYLLNYRLLRRNMYVTEPESATAKVANVHEFAFLKKFGAAGNLLALEMKLIRRNKRPRSLFISSFFMLGYGWIIYQSQHGDISIGRMVFFGVLGTGSAMFQYGQYLHSWDANYFDALMTKNISVYQYYRTKFLLFIGVCSLAFVVSLVYGFFGWKVMLVHFIAYLYNIGVNIYVILFLGVYAAKKIDLTKNAAYTWQGLGAVQYLIMFPMTLAPMGIFLPFSYFDQPVLGLVLIGTMGITGLIFHKPILKKMAERLNSRKYKMAAAFRMA